MDFVSSFWSGSRHDEANRSSFSLCFYFVTCTVVVSFSCTYKFLIADRAVCAAWKYLFNMSYSCPSSPSTVKHPYAYDHPYSYREHTPYRFTNLVRFVPSCVLRFVIRIMNIKSLHSVALCMTCPHGTRMLTWKVSFPYVFLRASCILLYSWPCLCFFFPDHICRITALAPAWRREISSNSSPATKSAYYGKIALRTYAFWK